MSTPRRSGFALLWSLMFLALVATIAAVVSPALMDASDVKVVSDAVVIVHNVADALVFFNTEVRVGNNFTGTNQTPNALTQLSTAIANGGNAGCTSGGARTYNGNSVIGWTNFGPFVQYPMTATGLYTPIGTINNALSGSATSIGLARAPGDPLWLQMQHVNVKLARLFDSLMGAASAGTDSVQLSAVATDSTVTISYRIGIVAASC